MNAEIANELHQSCLPMLFHLTACLTSFAPPVDSTEGCAREPYFPSLVPKASRADRSFLLRLTCKSRQRIPSNNLDIGSAFTGHCVKRLLF